MKFKSVSVNNCYILDKEAFHNPFFNYLNAKAIYSASLFHLAFFKGDLALLTKEEIKQYETFTIDLYRLNSPYLYIPFEINYHEGYLYQSYYESDHFPLSLWLEEKSLIPFNIFIQIIEDILQALKTLEKVGHSHLFLTPEEILIPLQWKEDTHVKLDNIGLNSIVHSVFNPQEISKYRNNFCKASDGKVEKKLTKNITEDLYSLGTILNRILPLCILKNEKDRLLLQTNIDKLLNHPESFNSIEQVILLFSSFILENEAFQSFSNTDIEYSYSGQASFDLPDLKVWKEEAELIPMEVGADDNSIKKVRVKKKKPSIFESVYSIFYRLFTRKKRSENVSKTLQDYKTVTDTSKPIIINKENTKLKKHTNSNLQTEQLINNIKKHYEKNYSPDSENNSTVYSKDDLTELNIKENKSTDFKTDKSRYSGEKDELSAADRIETKSTDNIITIFDNSLLERDYSRSYKIIKDALIFEQKSTENTIIEKLEKLLDDKIKLLEDHYIKNNSSNIILKLAKLDSNLPKEGTELSETIIKNLPEAEAIEPLEKLKIHQITNKNPTLFQKILSFLKSKFSKYFK